MTDISEFENMFPAAGSGDLEGAFSGNQGSEKGVLDRCLTGVDTPVEETMLEALGLSVERMERLKKLKSAIEGRRYFVSSMDVAERLMASMIA